MLIAVKKNGIANSKNTATIHPHDMKGLRAFKEDYPEAQCILLYRGKHRLKKDAVSCIPVDEFLLYLHPDTSIAAI